MSTFFSPRAPIGVDPKRITRPSDYAYFWGAVPRVGSPYSNRFGPKGGELFRVIDPKQRYHGDYVVLFNDLGGDQNLYSVIISCSVEPNNSAGVILSLTQLEQEIVIKPPVAATNVQITIGNSTYGITDTFPIPKKKKGPELPVESHNDTPIDPDAVWKAHKSHKF